MDFLQVLISGILIGGIYALVSLGLSLLFGVIKIVNFAHGEFLMLAMFFSYWLYSAFLIDPYVSLLFVIPVSAIFGAIIYKVFIKGVLHASEMVHILTTVALSIVLQNLVLMFIGPNERAVQTVYGSSSIMIGDLSIGVTKLLAFVAAIIVTGALLIFLKKTFVGKAIMAVAQDKTAAQYVGINVNKIYLITFIIATVCVSIAGTMILPIYSISPHIGSYFVLIAFVVVVTGGLGNIYGVIPAGLLIGIVEAVSGYYLPVSLKEVIYFSIFLLVLIVRPSGLFGKIKGGAH